MGLISRVLRSSKELRFRLLLLAGLPVVPSVAFIVYSASFHRAEAVRRVEADAVRLSVLASREHAKQIVSATDLLAALAASEPLWRQRGAPCSELFMALLRSSRGLANLGLLAPDGKVLCSVVPTPDNFRMSETSALRRALRSDKVELGEYQIGEIVHRPVLLLARTLKAEPRAALFAALDLQWLNQLASDADLPEGSAFAIVDRGGRVLAHPPGSQHEVGVPHPLAGGFPAIAGNDRSVVERPDPAGRAMIYAVASVAGIPGIHVVLGISKDNAFREVNRAMVLALAGLAAIAFFSLLVGLLGAELFVLRGIRALTRAARQLSAGNLTFRVPLQRGPTEIHDLGATFNEMADALARRQEEALRIQEQLRALSRRFEAVREEESARIARDLHDQLGQALTVIKLDLAWLGRTEDQAGGAGATQERIAEMIARVDDTIRLVREISQRLRPAVLDQLGLGAALEWQAQEFQAKTGIPCKVDLCPGADGVGAQLATTVLRIFQEALTNVSRHAGASAVWAELTRQEGALVLSVSDDGAGAPPGVAAQPDALGIVGMRERANLTGGTFAIHGVPGAGTRITVRLPEGRTP